MGPESGELPCSPPSRGLALYLFGLVRCRGRLFSYPTKPFFFAYIFVFKWVIGTSAKLYWIMQYAGGQRLLLFKHAFGTGKTGKFGCAVFCRAWQGPLGLQSFPVIGAPIGKRRVTLAEAHYRSCGEATAVPLGALTTRALLTVLRQKHNNSRSTCAQGGPVEHP